MEIKITPRYNPDRSYPEENKFFFEYDMEIITDKPIQFLEYELKMRCGGKEHEFYADHIHTEKPYIKGYYKTTRFIPSDFPHANLRGELTFVDDDANIIELELPLTFFKANVDEKL
jgi:uncharacterized protein affecting Mg2+/Co2+ transport